jgi:predicted dinucleotide-binding enzyme
MKAGVIGSGQVGRALARGLAKHGHEAMIGSRTPESLTDWIAGEGQGLQAGSFSDVAQFGEVVFLATLWTGTQDALELAGAANLDGKVLVDVTNPLDFSDGPPPKLALGYDTSAGEQVQAWVPGARVVKAFNIVGNTLMVDPDLPGGPPDMFIAGDDDGAKATVKSICEQWGWPVIDLGGLESARYLEPLAMVWIVAGFTLGNFNIAFKLLQGPAA